MSPELSVVLCTHNPRMAYLEEVLAALSRQTLAAHRWELILIDNASEFLVSDVTPLAWHPNGRVVREDALGLTRARLRGILDASSQLFCFVDDDNVLAPDYLHHALRISQEYPHLGAWNGQTLPRFEVEPPAWTVPYWPFLALQSTDVDLWSNLGRHNEATPCGAGLCVRRVVAERWRDALLKDPRRISLGRIGASLSSGEDLDLALTSCDMGLGTGIFTCLKLTHLISAGRVSESYLAKLYEGCCGSLMLLNYLRTGKVPPAKSLGHYLLWLYSYFKCSPSERVMRRARRRGEARALSAIHCFEKMSGSGRLDVGSAKS